MWVDEGEEAIVTALAILEEKENAANGGTNASPPGAGSPQYSG